MPKTQPPPPQRTVKRELPVSLSSDEVSSLARTFADHHAEMMRMEDQYSEVQMDWRRRIKDKRGVVKELCKQVSEQCKTEMVECTEIYDFDHDRIRIVRTDTGAVVEIREASEAEREAFEAIDLEQRQGNLLDDDAASG
jgi:phage host-nuclease inhibitor protein Gam